MFTTTAPSLVKVKRSQQFFNRLTLPWYDLVLYGLVSKFAWGASIQRLDAHYRKYATANHLEVGVGTGYLLDRVEFPSQAPRLALMDLSVPCLESTSRNVARYTPETYVQNLLEPIKQPIAPFDSIAVNYVMHCVPGDFAEKHVAFLHLATLLKRDGVLFGTTVLAQGVKKNFLAGPALWLLNAIGLFNNQRDNARDLECVLRRHFLLVEFEVVGVVAFFAAKKARH
ncbi:MAG TPA: class I SAM-dependent methyltransferase [Burkholderiaceae bacterium]|jgi:hypothetical protein